MIDESPPLQSPAFLSGLDAPLESIDEGITRQILAYNQEIMMVKVWFAQGAVGTKHHHIHSQVTYVESGEFEVTVGEETNVVVAGDSYFMEPNVIHGTVCKRAGVLIDVFSPIRDDFFEEIE